VVHDTFKFLKFHSKQDSKELQFHMKPVITKMMWALVKRAHPMVMARAYSVTSGRRSAGASQGRLNALSQISSQGDTARFTKNDLSAIVIPASSYVLELDPRRTKTAAQLKQLIKAEQEVYVSLLCQHATEEGNCIASSDVSIPLLVCADIRVWPFSIRDDSPREENYSGLFIPSVDATDFKFPLPRGSRTDWKRHKAVLR
jgi:hypothetical protein